MKIIKNLQKIYKWLKERLRYIIVMWITIHIVIGFIDFAIALLILNGIYLGFGIMIVSGWVIYEYKKFKNKRDDTKI